MWQAESGSVQDAEEKKKKKRNDIPSVGVDLEVRKALPDANHQCQMFASQGFAKRMVNRRGVQ